MLQLSISDFELEGDGRQLRFVWMASEGHYQAEQLSPWIACRAQNPCIADETFCAHTTFMKLKLAWKAVHRQGLDSLQRP